jgi:dihydropteroate synthase
MNHPGQTLNNSFPQRAVRWKLRTRELIFDRLPLLMGIVNVTPDSFSDGGKFFDPDQAVEQALRLVAEGADILDIGGESTRPYSEKVDIDEELRRVVPVLEALRGRIEIPISIDTSKAEVAKAAIKLGAEIINDVTGLTGDPSMLALAVTSKAGVCAMHMQGTPQTMQDVPHYDDVVSEIGEYLAQRKAELLAAGVEFERICLDPGIGFGKSHQHNLTLMTNCWRFHELGCPLLVGHSRKGFLAKVIGDSERDRTAATAGSAISLSLQGVQVIRVHDMRAVKDALLAFAATGGIDGTAMELAN